METREVPVYTELLGSQVRIGTLHLTEDTIDIIEAEQVNLILYPTLRILGEEWNQDACQLRTHVELMGLEARFQGAVPAEDPPF